MKVSIGIAVLPPTSARSPVPRSADGTTWSRIRLTSAEVAVACEVDVCECDLAAGRDLAMCGGRVRRVDAGGVREAGHLAQQALGPGPDGKIGHMSAVDRDHELVGLSGMQGAGALQQVQCSKLPV